VKNQFPAWCRGVDLLSDAFEADTAGVKAGYRVNQVFE
jgi:hypothetical protein